MKTRAIQKTAKTAGLTLAGSIAGYKAMGFVPGKFGPMAVLGAGAVGHVMSSNPMVQQISLGAAVIGAIGTLNQLSQPDASGIQQGYQRVIAQVTPQLSLPVNGMGEIDFDDYDFEQIAGTGDADEIAAAMLEGGWDDYEELQGLSGDEESIAASMLD
jgi:hypothetical protein